MPSLAIPAGLLRLIASLAEAANRAPRAALAWALGLHLSFWTLIPALVQPNLPYDVVEQLAWGREWQWTYFKHPPLPAWILDVFARLAGGEDRALFVVGPLASVLALFLVWKLTRDMLGERAALLAVLLQQAVLYGTYFSVEFNHNIVQLPLWVLIALTARRAALRGTSLDWMALGVASAVGMLGKYSTGLLLLSVLAWFVSDARLRRKFAARGPWIALAAFVVVLAPHAIDVAKAEFGPLLFPFSRVGTQKQWYDHVKFPIMFVGAQIGGTLPLLGLLALAQRDRKELLSAPVNLGALDRRLLGLVCWGPFVISVVLQALWAIKFRDMWGATFWVFLGPFAVVFLLRAVPPISARLLASAVAIFSVVLLAYAGQFLGAAFGVVSGRMQFPGAELARVVAQNWHRTQGQAPLRFVAGDVWLAGNVALGDWEERPSVLIDGNFAISPWIDRAALDCAGGVALWRYRKDGDLLKAQLPGLVDQPQIELPFRTWWVVAPVRIDWAILPPRPGCVSR